MGWNSVLHYYHQEVGGQYFGMLKERMPYALLLLPDPKGELLIRPRLRGTSQYSTIWDAEVCAKITMERPYLLRVKGESAVQEGLHTVLGGLDRGAKVLGVKTGFSSDYGVPQLAAHRSIRTNEQNFTKWVFQNRSMCAILEEKGYFGLKVAPMADGSPEHLVCARADMDQILVDDWELEMGSQTPGRKALEPARKELDRLVELCRAAREAVTTWPMPMQPG